MNARVANKTMANNFDDSHMKPSSNPLSLPQLAKYIRQLLKDTLKECRVINNELILEIAAKDIMMAVLQLRDNEKTAFKQLSDITAIDYPERKKRFQLVYQLLSIKNNQRARILLSIDEDHHVPSISSVFHAANWAEREVWDMFGISFSNHPDLRRILTDYGFDGHPLRKDFPLTGHVQVRYSDSRKKRCE